MSRKSGQFKWTLRQRNQSGGSRHIIIRFTGFRTYYVKEYWELIKPPKRPDTVRSHSLAREIHQQGGWNLRNPRPDDLGSSAFRDRVHLLIDRRKPPQTSLKCSLRSIRSSEAKIEKAPRLKMKPKTKGPAEFKLSLSRTQTLFMNPGGEGKRA